MSAPDPKPKIVVIYGPTASGKTALAIDIAKKFNGEVISSDSRQIYQDLDIGTEKVTAKEMSGVPHHLIDITTVDTRYTATDFKRDASEVISDLSNRDKLPIIAGGTFFYVDTLLRKIHTPNVPPNQTLRDHLEEMSVDTLYAELERLDPDRAFVVDKNNKRRLIRSLEIIDSLGKVPNDQITDCPYEVLAIGIKTNPQELRQRIKNRSAEAVKKGLIEETADLIKSGISKTRLAEVGLEYRVVIEFLGGEINEAALLKKLEEKNWQYAKRQLTWLKRDETIEWYACENRSAIFARIAEFLG